MPGWYELILQLHTNTSVTTLVVEELICVIYIYIHICVCVYICCLVILPLLYQKGDYTTMTLGELISNHTHTRYTTTIVGDLIV